EIEALQAQGIARIFSPEDGQQAGLDGIIGYMLKASDFSLLALPDNNSLARQLTRLEAGEVSSAPTAHTVPVLGVTGTGGAGKSSLIDELLLRFQADFPDRKVAVVCIDPSKSKTGGALLGDRLRLNAARSPRVFLRSFATRASGTEVVSFLQKAIELLQAQDFSLLVVETSGIGQADSSVRDFVDHSLYVMTPEYGAPSQLEKIDMLDYADFIAINKFERPQALDALRDVQTVVRRNRFAGKHMQNYPVYGVIASRFNDDGVDALYQALRKKMFAPSSPTSSTLKPVSSKRQPLISAFRALYLQDIATAIRSYHHTTAEQAKQLAMRESLHQALSNEHISAAAKAELERASKNIKLPATIDTTIAKWRELDTAYDADNITYKINDKAIKASAKFTTVANNRLPRVARPKPSSTADLWRYLRQENVPGQFPFTAGIFPLRRSHEEPKRQFAGEGSPAQTNRRFHYLTEHESVKRLSTAFDSVTLYGSDPDLRPDIFGKVGESGVSIATLDDMKQLYAGFDLCDPSTSVSMTINGPAPIILAMFLNTAIDQQVAKTKASQEEATRFALQNVRGTVQSDILKEDQAQNTCIFSTEFALRMMGDVQEFFIQHDMQKYYSVSISGFHIAEAGANPITQLAFTLANGFTYVEYYLARGMQIDDFANNLSFFFSSGLDAEYAVLGRVARRIWAIAMRDVYGANINSQKLKYHVQTSGRSLHAQEMEFNDTRTTLQALMALCENCNSLHTNAYDEALTTPTEESVRRAMAIQLIINRELGMNTCENFFQGSYFVEQLTDLVEEQVLAEFERISSRGGVLGAMETQYQRSKIQEESLHYEELKHTGKLPIVGVNTFIPAQVSERPEVELIRSAADLKQERVAAIAAFKHKHSQDKDMALKALATAVRKEQNIFAELMRTVRHATLKEITDLLFELGGEYRRLL
ncbi:MAG: methylmalonyl-CoA mutase family protein, partial [Pseudomonadota bacterium]|nr:methylmalonyl-CoA mutase family protein [Pseudomonadota bacterium]